MSKRGVCNIILNGNRTNTGFSTGTGNELSTDGTWNFTFDNEGNITKAVHISDGLTWTFNYDNLNHLNGAQQRQTDGGTLLIQTSYIYDVHANLIERDVWTQVGGTTTTARYALDGNEVWADLDGSNTLQTRYLHGDAVDNLFARTSAAGAVGWYLSDHLGSVRDIMGNTGTVLDHIDYDPFGNITNETNASSGDRYKYALLQWDTQLGLYWAGRRFFYASDGRWMSQDPIGFKARDTNLYRYVQNDPVNSSDRSGLMASQGGITINAIVPIWTASLIPGLGTDAISLAAPACKAPCPLGQPELMYQLIDPYIAMVDNAIANRDIQALQNVIADMISNGYLPNDPVLVRAQNALNRLRMVGGTLQPNVPPPTPLPRPPNAYGGPVFQTTNPGWWNLLINALANQGSGGSN